MLEVLGLIPTDAFVRAMTLQPQECPQAQTNVVTLRPRDQRELLEVALIALSRPCPRPAHVILSKSLISTLFVAHVA
jgi:hypothetical protein